MGCCQSSESQAVEMQPTNISAPTGGPVLVPPPYRDATGRPIQHQSHELSRETMTQALNDMAMYLMQARVGANVIAVGGAVNTLYLRSRASTHDVDFFLGDPRAQEHTALHQAARHANRQARGSLGPEWFNNSTQIMMGRGLQQQLAAAAVQQNVVVYDHMDGSGGLRIYAAPWSYAFCGKLNRLCESNPRPYDLADAIEYLRQHLESHGQQTVSAGRIRRWCEQYGKNVTDEVIQMVDDAYLGRYEYRPITWQSRS